MKEIFNFYVNSTDFNGISIFDLEKEFKSDEIESIITDLIREKKVTISIEENPHIKHFPEVPVETQLNRLKTHSGIICVYPSPAYLKKNVDPNKFKDSPFTRELLLGTGQLEPQFFDLPVLDYYFNDPRYLVLNSDYSGSISIKDEFYFDEKVHEKDKISLKTFGLGFNEDGDRVITVFLRYLSDLSPEHQQIWNTYKLTEKCYLDPDYFKNTILGEWAEYVPIYQAFCEELYQINKMCKLIGKPPLFKNDFKEKRPEDFKIFLKPTLKNYNDFIHVLDKMLSENINKKFFKGEIEFNEEITRRDGKIEVRPKGSIRIFEEWLKSKFKTDDEFYQLIFDPIKDIRRQRQKPAHKIDENEYNRAYHQKQDEIMRLAYISVKYIRLALSNHPNVRDYKVPDWLYEGRIRRYTKKELKMFKSVYTEK